MPTLRRVPSTVLPALLLAAPLPVAAHALAVRSSPASGATVAGPTVAVEIEFNSRIDIARSRLALKDPAGHSRTLAISGGGKPDLIEATAKGLAPGAYVLRWQVLAIDGHITRGDIPFRIKAP